MEPIVEYGLCIEVKFVTLKWRASGLPMQYAADPSLPPLLPAGHPAFQTSVSPEHTESYKRQHDAIMESARRLRSTYAAAVASAYASGEATLIEMDQSIFNDFVETYSFRKNRTKDISKAANFVETLRNDPQSSEYLLADPKTEGLFDGRVLRRWIYLTDGKRLRGLPLKIDALELINQYDDFYASCYKTRDHALLE